MGQTLTNRAAKENNSSLSVIILDYVYYYVKHEVLISHVNNNVVIKRPSPDIIYFTYKFFSAPTSLGRISACRRITTLL